jgi:hypothetical protein
MRHWTHAVAVGLAALPWIFGATMNQVRAQNVADRDAELPAVFQASGPNAASILTSVDEFRFALGAVNNGTAPGPLASGRREINWDGGGSSATSLAGTPFAGFLLTRGALFATPGTGFVQAPAAGLAETFANPAHATDFQAFSPVRLFSPIDSNVTDVQFFVPGSGHLPATTRGFGAIFADVDRPDGSGPGKKRGNRGASTQIRYYGEDGRLLYSSFAPASPGDATISFLGIVFEDARIASVRITTGAAAPGGDDDDDDAVVMDDFIFGEPQLAP